MPRGKRKAYADTRSPDPEPKRHRRSAPHKRGGKHRVKPEHLTGTHWDDRDHKELLGIIKEPSRMHLYRKDMKKHEMAQALADDDAAIARGQKEREREIKKKKFEAAKKQEKEKQEKLTKEKEKQEKQERRAERESRRLAGDEDVSDTTNSEAEQLEDRELRGIERYGVLVEDSISSSSESETTIPSAISPIHPLQKLRIFECQDLELPSLYPQGEHEEDDLPLKVPYTVMKLVTTCSQETLELPGRNYPDDIDTDHVPRLSPETIMAARNGTMVGALRKAIIESGVEWARRTHVQGWNGRMYLQLPARTSAVPLADVYSHWRKNRKGKTSVYEYKTSRAAQDPEKYKDKKDMLLDIYASSKYRPPICYIPAYLDYPWDVDEEFPVSIDNLFYVRFPGMDLPHYYFWTEPGDWPDPTTPNPEWKGVQEIDQRRESRETQERKLLFEDAAREQLQVKSSEIENPLRPYPLDRTKTRVKKKSIPRKFQAGVKQQRTSKYKSKLWTIEKELYQHGLTVVLLQYRNQWLEGGRTGDWEYLIDKMPKLFPSGKLPDNPPVHVNQVPRSLAEKIAAIEVPHPERPVSPIRGDEPWTRNDNEYWEAVNVAGKQIQEEDIQQELLRTVESLDLRSPSLMRRRSSDATLPRDFRGFDSWLKSISTASPPLESAMDEDPVGKALRIFERQAWEGGFEKHALEAATGLNLLHATSRSRRPSEVVPELITQIESMPVEELKWQLYTLMDERLKHDTCRVCLEPLDHDDPATVNGHYQSHRDEADSRCPFCSMDWGMLDSHWKANHILFHERDDYPVQTERLYRRRSSSFKPPARKPSASARKGSGWDSSKARPRRSSKVTFAPVTVERRIAYNDMATEDAGVDADVSSLGAPSPRKSSLKLQHRKAEKQG
ncbi:hypothetical protein BDV96DRAFT_200759 [Lophiotrema nucula]|uniref:Uncharacterized protein n=1 Tax=Lophiotrema nucula TaxID=690887 RepID=A0A6A5YTJ7_9PLEO|nr:hypothetical protein BDV96DRAFT_200759 [Lophiotrema nucula]